MIGSLKDLLRGIPNGPVWDTGRWWKLVLNTIIGDRVIAGTGIDEIPTADGRVWSVNGAGPGSGGGTTMRFTVIIDGATREVDITSAQLVEEEEE